VLTLTQHRSRNVLALVALSAFCGQAATPVVRADNYVARAKQFLGKLYPSLDDLLRGVIMGNRLRDPAIMKPDPMSRFTMELYGPERRFGQRPTTSSSPDPVLRAQFTFDWQTENKELLDLMVSGPFVQGRRDEFAKEVDKHPEWSDAKAMAALNEAGAKYGPDHKDELLRALPLEELKPFMGGELEVVSAELYLRPGTSKKADLTWGIRTKWHSPDGREAGCTLIFEPFEGKLQSIFRDALTHQTRGESGKGAEQME